MRDRYRGRRRSRSRSRSRSRYYTSSDDDLRALNSNRSERSRTGGENPSNLSSRQAYVGGPGDVLRDIDREQINGLVPPPYEVDDLNITSRPEAEGGSFVIVTFMSPRDATEVITKLDGVIYKGRRLRVRRVSGEPVRSDRPLIPAAYRPTDRVLPDTDMRMHIMTAMSRPDNQETDGITQYVRMLHLWKVGDQLLHERGEDKFFEEIWDDVNQEVCKYSPVKKYWIDKMSDNGAIYFELDSPVSVRKVRQTFNGRWFGGSKIRVESIPVAEWNYHIPKFMLD